MQIQSLLHRQGGHCFYCRKPLAMQDASIDHVIPQCMGFYEGFTNLVACCREINSLFQGLPPKHKIEIVLNAGGLSACPKDLEKNNLEIRRREMKISSAFNEPMYGSGLQTAVRPQESERQYKDRISQEEMKRIQEMDEHFVQSMELPDEAYPLEPNSFFEDFGGTEET